MEDGSGWISGCPEDVLGPGIAALAILHLNTWCRFHGEH